MLEKYFIVLIFNINNQNRLVAYGLASLAILFYGVLVAVQKPYVEIKINITAQISNFITFATLILGMTIESNRESYAYFNHLAKLFIIFINFSFFLLIVI